MRARAASVLIWAASLVLVAGAAELVTVKGASALPLRSSSPNPSSSENELTSVSAVSATNAWAVGSYRNDTTGATDSLILHWDGTAWSKVRSPNPSSTSNGLDGVSADSGTDAWAVGSYVDDTTAGLHTLILHWNGTSWAKVKSPAPSSSVHFLRSVDAQSPTDAWAVGWSGIHTWVLHWDGTAWSQVPSPNPSSRSNLLFGVSADSQTDAWAVGKYRSDTTRAYSTLALHWDGLSWTKVDTPDGSSTSFNSLSGVASDSSTDAWAMGYFKDAATGDYNTLALHWDGSAWSRVTSPNPGASYNVLSGTGGDTATDVWAVGFYPVQNGQLCPCHTLILRWDGSAWSKVKSPSPGTLDNVLSAVSADSQTDAWAVGYYDNDGPIRTLTLHWNGTSWVKV